MIRNFSLTLRNIAEPAVRAVVAQQKSLDFLAKVVLDNRMALDYLLAEQGGIYFEANTTCCISINTSMEAETQLCKTYEQAI